MIITRPYLVLLIKVGKDSILIFKL